MAGLSITGYTRTLPSAVPMYNDLTDWRVGSVKSKVAAAKRNRHSKFLRLKNGKNAQSGGPAMLEAVMVAGTDGRMHSAT